MPRLETVRWAPGRKDEFLQWIHQEISQTMGDRQELERKWENSIIQWRAQLPENEVDFPFPGASNLELPLTGMHADPVLADMVQSFHAPEDYWTPVARRSDRVDHATPLRQGMTLLEKRYLKLRQVNMKAFLYNIVLGTAVYKNNWKSERRRLRRYDDSGKSQSVLQEVSQPCVEHVPLQKFWFPADAWSIDPLAPGGARWCAQEFWLTKAEVKAWAEGSSELPTFDKSEVEEILKHEEDSEKPIDEELRREDKYEPFRDTKIRLFEVWAQFDTTNEGINDEVVAIYHYNSGSLLRAIYNPNAHGKRPFHVTNYLPGFGIYGIGLSELDEWAQEAGTGLLNNLLDNTFLANSRMFSAPYGSNIQPGESVYPGKIWFVGPDEKIGEIRLGEVYPSMFQSLGQVLQLSELRSGVSELRQGNLSGLPSRTPATSLLSILREGNKRFDMIHSNIREEHSEMGLRMLQNVAQRASEDSGKWGRFFANALGQEDAMKIMEVLLGSPADIEEAFGISVTATSAQVNKEVEKQSFIGMLQIVGQIYGQLVQTAMLKAQIPDPVVQATATASYASGVELLTRLLERFDIQNPSAYLSNLEAISKSLNAQQQGVNPALGGLFEQNNLGILGGAQGVPPGGGLGGFGGI